MVAGRPVLGGLGRCPGLQHHVHQARDGLHGLAALFLILQSEDTENDVVEKLDQSVDITLGKLDFLVLGGIDDADCIEDVREGGRSVQVVAECVVDALEDGLHLRVGGRTAVRRHPRRVLAVGVARRRLSRHRVKVLRSLQDAFETLFRGLQGLVGEVQRPAIMGLEYEETNCHGAVSLVKLRMVAGEQLRQRDEVAQGLAHLLPVDGDHVVVHPVMYPLCAPGSHILGDFALMMREHQVHAAAMDVELVSEVLLSHDRALQVPSRETLAPRGRPFHDMLRLGFLPQGEVERSVLVALAVQRARPFESRVQAAPGKDAVAVVFVVFLHVEIHGAVADIGITGIKDLLDGFDLLDDVP